MTIDWFTLLAQLFNFALLLVLLRVFLYRPVLATMRRREELAMSALQGARELQAEAEAQRRELEAAREREERERQARLAALDAEVEALRRDRLEAVEREAEALRRARSEAVERGVERAVERLRSELAAVVLDEVRQTLAWLADAELERQAVALFLARLEALPAEERGELAAAAADGEVRFVTAHALDEGARSAVRDALARALGVDGVSFATEPDLLAGAVLEVGGLRLDGSAAARVRALDERFTRVLADLRGGDEGAA